MVRYNQKGHSIFTGRKFIRNLFMKASRLLAYGIAGIIGGLLIENSALIFRRNAENKVRKLKKKIHKAVVES